MESKSVKIRALTAQKIAQAHFGLDHILANKPHKTYRLLFSIGPSPFKNLLTSPHDYDESTIDPATDCRV